MTAVNIFRNNTKKRRKSFLEANAQKIKPLSQNKAPIVEDIGFDLTPNTLTQVALHLTSIKRVSAPYTSKCIKQWKGIYKFVNTNAPLLPYSVVVSLLSLVT